MRMRYYQSDALSASKSALGRGVHRQVIVLPTGTGKTPVMAYLKQHHGFSGQVIVLLHTDELAQQAADKLRTWNPGAKVGIEMGKSWADLDCDFVVMSVATVGRKGGDEEFAKRLQRWDRSKCSALLVDECHHGVAESYLRVYTYFGLLDELNTKLLLGVTATPNRGDKVALGSVFDEIVYEMTTERAIREGWLVPPRGFRAYSEVNLDTVKTVAGDFAQDQLQTAVNIHHRNALVVNEWMRCAATRKTVVFCTGIEHAKALADEFMAAGYAAQAVWGSDPHRAEKLAAHRKGQLQIICNAQLLIEGYDDPSIECVVLARPTKSRQSYQQMIGRGLRLPEGCDNRLEAEKQFQSLSKWDCIILDVTDNAKRHSLVSLNSLFGLPPKMNLNGKTVTEAIDEVAQIIGNHPQVDATKAATLDELKAMVEQVDLFAEKWAPDVIANSQLCWHTAEDGSHTITLPNGESLMIFKNMLGHWEVFGSISGNTVHDSGYREVSNAFRFAEDMLTIWGKEFLASLRRDATWQKEPMTEKQANFLKKVGMYDPTLTKDQARQRMAKFMFARNKGAFFRRGKR